MSIHELAKQIGVSEYALKKYGKENGIFRAGESSRFGYEFSKRDLEKIKSKYARYSHNSKREDDFAWIFYKCIFQPGNVRYSTPVGRYDVSQKELLSEFINSQKYISPYGKLSCHFEIVNDHTAMLRISKILGQKIDEDTCSIICKALPLKMEDIQNAMQSGKIISDIDLFGNSLEPESMILEMNLDDLTINANLE